MSIKSKTSGGDSNSHRLFIWNSTLEISQNSCSIARQCPMKYKWLYVDGYKPIQRALAMTLGSVVHEALDKFYSGCSVGESVQYIRTVMDEQIANASVTEQEDLQIIRATAICMIDYFPFKDLGEFEEIKSEKEFAIPIQKDVVLVGRSDRLVKINGKWWVGELKTSGQSFNQFCNRASVSDQVTTYVYAWRKLGYPVQGVLFDYFKKPLLRKGVNETCQDYCLRIAFDYRNRIKDYFQRHYEYRSDHVIKFWEEDLALVIERIKDIWRGKYYRNTESCWSYNSECPFLKICFQETPDPLTIQLYYTKEEKKWKATASD